MARIRVSWDEKSLARKAEKGYGVQEATISGLVKDLATKDPGPSIVCFYDKDDQKALSLVNRNIFSQENVGIGAKKFKLYQVRVDQIRNEETRKTYAKNTPSYHFFDALGGGKASLRGEVTLPQMQNAMKRTFEASYAASYKGYLSEYRKFLNKLDQVEQKKKNLRIKRTNLARKSAGKAAREGKAIDLEEAFLEKSVQKVLSLEEKILAKVKLRKKMDQRVSMK